MPKAKYIMLLPVTFNDGTTIPIDLISQIEDQLFALADGYTIAGTAKGAYRMRNGSKKVDDTVQYWIVIERDDEPALRSLVATFAALLAQESMYLERADGAVDFVPPPEEPSDE